MSCVAKAADEPPASTQLTHCQHQFIAALLERQIHGVVLRIHDAEKCRIAETLGTAAAIENLTIQKHGDFVAVADIEFLYLIAVGLNDGLGIEHLHTRLGFKALGEVSLERDSRVRSLSVSL